jgi:methyl-accepting chemotaxis protein
MRIRTQLFALIGAFAAVFAGFVALSLASQTERAEDSIYRPILDTKDLVADILPPPAFILEAHQVALDLGGNPDPAERAADVATLGRLEKEYQERRDVWRTTIEAGTLKDAIEKANQDAERYFDQVHTALLPAVSAGDLPTVSSLVRGPLKATFLAHRAGIDQVVSLAELRSKQQVGTAAASVRSTKTTLLAVGALAIVLSLLMGWRISRGIAVRLGEVGRALERVASGDYTQQVEASSRDEIGDLQRALNDTVRSGREMLTQLRASAAELGGASQRLSESTVEVAEGAQRQADLVSRTVGGLQSLSANVQENSVQASQASRSAEETQGHAQSGTEVLERTRASMRAISEASRKVEQIISVIDEFAFQTNIVALNAAVEAARAGDAGRGFAVVANEVRSLAQRSAGSAREVRALVADTIAKVKAGEGLVKQSETAFQQIATATGELKGAVEAMSESFRGQADSLGTVTRELTTVNSVTQRNAAESEQLSGMSELLRDQSHRLDELTRRFVLDERQGDLRPREGTRAEADLEAPVAFEAQHLESRPHLN